jgi:hypothetical protein
MIGKDDDKPKGRGKGAKRKSTGLHLVAGSTGANPAGNAASVVIPLAKGQGRDANGLTSKMEAFCQGVGTRGETLSAAYRAAYDAAGMSATTVHNEACKLMANPNVSARVNVLVREKQVSSSHDAARIRQHVIDRLHAESTDPDNPPSARVQALKLLGSLDIVGAFRERVVTETAQAPADALADTLEARLKALLAKAG